MNKNQRKIIGWILLIVFLLASLSALTSFIVFNQKGSGVIIGGCASVHQDYIQECCDTLAKENNLFHIHCDGNWIIEENDCKWECAV